MIFLFSLVDALSTFWIDGYNLGAGDTFVWASNGKSLEFTNWIIGEPNNKIDLANCITIGANSEYEWLDYMCTSKSGLICEDNRFVTGFRKDWEIKKEFIQRLFSI